MLIDPALDVLLDFNGVVLEQENGYQIKIEARLVDASVAIPHGIRYSLTLHDLYGKRIIGYDNAHAIKLPKNYKNAGRHLIFDHKHRHVSDRGVPYAFTTVQQLLNDFFADVNGILEEVKK
jgi:hypothetical protein